MKMNQRIPIALVLLENCRAEREILQKPGMLDGIRGEQAGVNYIPVLGVTFVAEKPSVSFRPGAVALNNVDFLHIHQLLVSSVPLPRNWHFVLVECQLQWKKRFKGILCSSPAASKVQRMLMGGRVPTCKERNLRSCKEENHTGKE